MREPRTEAYFLVKGKAEGISELAMVEMFRFIGRILLSLVPSNERTPSSGKQQQGNGQYGDVVRCCSMPVF